MKKWMMKLISVFMSILFVLSLGITAFAEEVEPEKVEQKQEEIGIPKQAEELELDQLAEPDTAADLAIGTKELPPVPEAGVATIKSVPVAEISNPVEPQASANPPVELGIEPSDGNNTDGAIPPSALESQTIIIEEDADSVIEDTNGEENDSAQLQSGETNEVFNPENQQLALSKFQSLGQGASLLMADAMDGAADADQTTDSTGAKSATDAPDTVLVDAAVSTEQVTDTGKESAAVGSTVITLDGTELNGNKETNTNEFPTQIIPGTKVETFEGVAWSASEGILSLANQEVHNLTVKEGDLTMQMAGFNRINTLISNSVVNIIGTGILLLDEAKLGESGEVNLVKTDLYPNVEGSVAVFLKEQGNSSNYNLINGAVPGILDEMYKIPEGINLVMPKGTTLILNSSAAAGNADDGVTYYTGNDVKGLPGDERDKIAFENSALLTISNGASLKVEKGATIEMLGTVSAQHFSDATNILTPQIVVETGGVIEQRGKLKGTAGIVSVSGSSSDPDYEVAVVDPAEFKQATAIMPGESIDALINALLEDGHSAGEWVGFDELKAAWETLYPGSVPEDAMFVLKVGGAQTQISKENGKTIQIPGGASALPWAKGDGYPYTGIGLGGHHMTVTGSGIVAGKLSASGSGTIGKFTPTGAPVTILSGKPTSIAAMGNAWRVVVTENPDRGTWTLSVYDGDTPITNLGTATVRARFDFHLPDGWDGQNIYVVFVTKDGSLRAIPAVYDALSGQLVFDSSLVGEFVVVNFEYNGELYSADFYQKLAKLDAVKHLLALHNVTES